MRINYRRISLRHNLSMKCRKIVKFVSITHSESNIWNGPRWTPARWMGWSCSAHRQHLLRLATPVTRSDSVWFIPVAFRQDNVYVPPLPKTLPELQTAHRHSNGERHTRHAWEGLVGMGVSPVHLPCHTGGAHRKHLRSLIPFLKKITFRL